MGTICLAKKQYDKALVYFDKAIEIYPYFVEACYNKGFVYQERLDIANIIHAYRQVIEFGDDSQQFAVTAKSLIKDIAFKKKI
jgi:tetratricopeptide (TPR) repeat protein